MRWVAVKRIRGSFKWDMMHLIGCVFTVFVGGGAPPLCSHHLSSVNGQHMHSLLCGLWINTHYHEAVCGVSVLHYICAQFSSNNWHLKCGLKHQKHQKWAKRVQLWTSTLFRVQVQSAHCSYNSFRFNEGMKHFTIILLLILSTYKHAAHLVFFNQITFSPGMNKVFWFWNHCFQFFS